MDGADADGTTPDLGTIAQRLNQLEDLFRRRLVEDKDKRRAFDALYERLEAAERAAEGAAQLPLVHQMILVVDRIDAHPRDRGDFVDSIGDELREILRRVGVEEVPIDGVFDPAVHEIVGAAPSDIDGTELLIATTHRRGYRTGHRVIRPAHVSVAAGRPGPPPAGDTTDG